MADRGAGEEELEISRVYLRSASAYGAKF